MTDQELEQGIGRMFRKYMKTREDYFLYKFIMRDVGNELSVLGHSLRDHPERFQLEWINREAFTSVVRLADQCEGNLMKAIQEASQKFYDLRHEMQQLHKSLSEGGYAIILKDLEF